MRTHTIIRPQFLENNEANSGPGWRKQRKNIGKIAASLCTIQETEEQAVFPCDTFLSPPANDPSSLADIFPNPYIFSPTSGSLKSSLSSLCAANVLSVREDDNLPFHGFVPSGSSFGSAYGSSRPENAPRSKHAQESTRQQQSQRQQPAEPITASRCRRSLSWPMSERSSLSPPLSSLFPSSLSNLGSPSLQLIKIAERSIKQGHMSLHDFALLQQQDDEIQSYLSAKAKSVHMRENGIIYKGNKIYLPLSLLRPAVECIHRENPALHVPRTTTLRKLSARYFRKKLRNEVFAIYDECFVCALSRPEPTRKQKLFSQFVPSQPREAFYIDILDLTAPVAQRTKSPRYAIIACDAFSHYIVIAPLENRSKEKIAEALIRNVLAPFGKPTHIISDNESAITSDFIQNLLAANNIGCHLISPKSPWANGAERCVSIFKKHIMPLLVASVNYTELLPIVMQMVNSIPSSTVPESTPELLFFSRVLDGPKNPLLPSERLTLLRDYSVAAASEAHKKLLAEREKSRAHANRTRKERTFQPDELVFLREPTVQSGRALTAPAGELFVVRKKAGPAAYWLECPTRKTTIKRHGAHLYPLCLSQRAQFLSPSWDELLSRESRTSAR